jgi:hypothetical protein
LAPAEIAEAVRSHWGIENQLHWLLDVTIKENSSTVRNDNAPENLSLLKKIILNLLWIDTKVGVKSSLRLNLNKERRGIRESARVSTDWCDYDARVWKPLGKSLFI